MTVAKVALPETSEMPMAILRDICKFNSGGTPDRANPDFYGGVTPWISGADIGPNGSISPRSQITELALSRSAARVVDPGTILLVTRTTVGKVTVAPYPVSFSQDITAITPRPEALDTNYLVEFLKSQQHYFNRNARGATIKGITQDVIRNLAIPLPSLPEQRRIATILDKADHLRTQRRAALTHLDTLARSIFNDMFGDPVSNSSNWPTAKLSTLGKLGRGVSKHRPRNDPMLLNGTHPLIQTGDVANSGGYITEFKTTYSDLGLSQSKIWPIGTLCITIAANIAKTGILKFKACFPDSVVGFTADESTVVFVQVWMGFLQKILENNAPESAQKNINLAILRNLDVIVPPLELQQTFASRVAGIERLKEQHRAQLTELDNLFASLQHRAFSGQL